MDSILIRGILKSKYTKVAVIALASILSIIMLNGAIIATHLVVITDGDVITTVYTSEDQPENILDGQKITLKPGDNFDFSGFKKGEATIIVNRAKDVSIKVDNQLISAVLSECTVAAALEDSNVVVGENDLINVSLEETVVDNMTIEINRVTFDEVREQQPIDYDVVETKTPTLKENKRKTLKAGEEGVLETVTKKKLVDGIVVDEYVTSSAVIKTPQNAQILVGDSDTAVSRLAPKMDYELDDNGNPVEYKQKLVGKATAYSARGKSTKLKPGNVAMDTSAFPKGTQLYIKTPDGSFVYGYSIVKDTGHALVNGDILVDLFFSSYKESCLFGAKQVEIYVL